MNNIEISRFFAKIDKRKMNFLGVFACDLLPKNEIKNLPCSLVVNLSRSSEIGSHWISIFIDSQRVGHYFDSFGMQPYNIEIKNFLKRQCIRMTWSRKELQSSNSPFCGAYAICFIMFMMQNPYSVAEEFGQAFSTNQFINDLCIQATLQKIKKQSCIQ
jgi:hypothetical protein